MTRTEAVHRITKLFRFSNSVVGKQADEARAEAWTLIRQFGITEKDLIQPRNSRNKPHRTWQSHQLSPQGRISNPFKTTSPHVLSSSKTVADTLKQRLQHAQEKTENIRRKMTACSMKEHDKFWSLNTELQQAKKHLYKVMAENMKFYNPF